MIAKTIDWMYTTVLDTLQVMPFERVFFYPLGWLENSRPNQKMGREKN